MLSERVGEAERPLQTCGGLMTFYFLLSTLQNNADIICRCGGSVVWMWWLSCVDVVAQLAKATG
jgi:hypothetical protein